MVTINIAEFHPRVGAPLLRGQAERVRLIENWMTGRAQRVAIRSRVLLEDCN